MNSFKGMFGGQQPGGQSHSAFDQPTGGAPWGAGGNAATAISPARPGSTTSAAADEPPLTTIRRASAPGCSTWAQNDDAGDDTSTATTAISCDGGDFGGGDD